MKNLVLTLALLLPACLDTSPADSSSAPAELEPDRAPGACAFPDAPPLSAHIRDGQATITEAEWDAELTWRLELADYANCLSAAR